MAAESKKVIVYDGMKNPVTPQDFADVWDTMMDIVGTLKSSNTNINVIAGLTVVSGAVQPGYLYFNNSGSPIVGRLDVATVGTHVWIDPNFSVVSRKFPDGQVRTVAQVRRVIINSSNTSTPTPSAVYVCSVADLDKYRGGTAYMYGIRGTVDVANATWTPFPDSTGGAYDGTEDVVVAVTRTSGNIPNYNLVRVDFALPAGEEFVLPSCTAQVFGSALIVDTQGSPAGLRDVVIDGISYKTNGAQPPLRNVCSVGFYAPTGDTVYPTRVYLTFKKA